VPERRSPGGELRILLIFPFVPYPPTDGGRIGFFNPIKYLSRKHELAVLTLATAEEEDAAAGLRAFCADVRLYRRPSKGDMYRLMRGAMWSPPGSSAKYWHAGAGTAIQEAIAHHKPDIVEFHHLNTAGYRRFAGKVPTLLREHNVEYKVWERHAETATRWAEMCYAKWTAPRVRKYEGEAASKFDRCVVVSEADAVHLKKVSPKARIEVIPSGVDTEYFHPFSEAEEEPWSVTLTGSFEWKPKQQSLRKLLTEVFPRIKAKVPEAKLYVVGKGVPAELRRQAEQTPGARIIGPVQDVREYIARSALMINYLESGGGIALKVLEAMAMKRPVLSNSLGCEGIPVKHGRDVFLADGLEEFAEAAAYLLKDHARRRGLAEEGFRRVLEGYSWNVIAGRFQDCYQSVIEEHRGAAQEEAVSTSYAYGQGN
jgi:glycosyltransferase involved in cell wall biosynthesis